MSFENNQLYRFKEFLLDVGEKVLLKNGEEISITPKAFHLLQILVENHGAIVKKDRLFSEIWTNSFVEEGNLAFTARILRKVLGDDAKHPVFIETVPRKGYRFIANVSDEAEVLADGSTVPISKRKPSPLMSIPFVAAILVFAISILLAAGWYFSARSGNSTASAPILSLPFNAVRLTSSGDARNAVISPNGNFVAYFDQTNEKWSVWLKQLSTSENIQIIPPSAGVYAGLVFSRDGNSLFFTRGDERKRDIYRINTFGGIPTKLAANTEGWISVSPDDKQISFVRCTYSQVDYCSLFIADATSGNERRIYTSPEPSRIADNQFSPDGRYIAFAAGQSKTGSNEFGLYRFDLSNGNVDELASRKFFNIKSLRWLPDGDGLLITARDASSHKFSIWNVSNVSGEAIQLTNDDANFSGLSLDAAGEMLVATKVDNNFTINYESANDPTSRKPLASGTEIALAPDGTIIYASAEHDIWKIDKDGNNKRQLTSDPAMDIAPLVSSNGKVIYFTSNRSGVHHIWQMNIDGSDQKQITREVGGLARLISSDGDWLYYRAPLTNSFRKIRANGEDEQDAPEIGGKADAFSPDGRSVAYFIKDAEPDASVVAFRDIGDERSIRVIKFAERGSEPVHLQWSRDGRNLFCVTRLNNRFSLWRLSADTTTVKFMADIGSDRIERIYIDDDGSMISVRGKWLHDAFLIRGLKR